jgi:hypothetical protein
VIQENSKGIRFRDPEAPYQLVQGTIRDRLRGADLTARRQPGARKERLPRGEVPPQRPGSAEEPRPAAAAEHILVGRRGDEPFYDRQNNLIEEMRRGAHSRKPEAIYERIQRTSPPPWLEMFPRRFRDSRPREKGWVMWPGAVRA